MFATKPLSSIKNAIPSIHQPLPLSSRESQKLLNVLKASFRKNLDKEHGYAPEIGDLSAAKATSSTHSSSSRDTHRRPTDQHLRSILSNPLFKSGAQLSSVPSATPRDPMDVFDDAVSRGMMTRKAATGCLKTKRMQILQSSALSVQDSMMASTAGLRVVQWLRSSGQERTLDFLGDQNLTRELIPFMVAEGLEEVAWSWADRTIRGEGPADERGKVVGALVAHLVAAKANVEDRNLDTAFSAILRAESTWKAESQLPRILLSPFLVLSWQSTVEAWKRPQPSTPLFDSFVGTANYILHPRLHLAHLDLHHPTNPSHEKALVYLNTGRDSLEGDSGLARRLMLMGMDAVSHLTMLGRTEEANGILRLLQSKISKDLWQKHRSRGLMSM
ncbi:hypothetical protein CORC01_06532 [Colletotrichum orchidophilum]|uniref:Uncharacterized protein n=1 Tax=Colletotrichum orchidophilum TaxID=1209926 RepID=A0A1G4B9R9_9PEZI|nr:uncharacterized protein CORC01_06532 [Colletotrichum orchidophilum]OHE98164.1 hypothetical protein CORC01_06532 [Colletotrichum orchidophilum]